MMKRINGLVIGRGLLTAGTIGGVAFAATRGSISVTPLSSWASYLRSVSRMWANRLRLLASVVRSWRHHI